MKDITIIALTLFYSIQSFSQAKDINTEYKSIKIGKQEWMDKDLNVQFFRNGDEIPQAKNEKEWMDAIQNKQPSWMYLNFSEENKAYSKLYNWFALHDKRIIAPNGWEVCTEIHVKELISEIGPIKTSGKKLKSINGWAREGEKNGTDEFGYNALQNGSYNPFGNSDSNAQNASWWTATIRSKNTNKEPQLGIAFYLVYFSDEIGWETPDENEGRAIRCLKKK